MRARRTVSLDIPAGVETGLRLQLPGSGEVGPAGGPNGDLYVEVTVSPHEEFSRDGDDLLATLEVSMSDAILGTTTTIESLDGPVDLELRAGVQGGDVLTIKGRGITPLRGTQRGDLRVGVHVVTPTRLDAQGARAHRGLREAHQGAAAPARRVPPGSVRQASRPFPERVTDAAALPPGDPGARTLRRPGRDAQPATPSCSPAAKRTTRSPSAACESARKSRWATAAAPG